VRVSGSEDYLPAGATGGSATAILETEGNRRLAMRRLAALLMRQAFEELSSGG